VEEEVVVGLGEGLQVFQVDLPFIRMTPSPDPVKEDLRFCLQENDEIGVGSCR